MFRGVALAPVTARLRRVGHVPGVLTAALPRDLTRSRLVRHGPLADDVAAALTAALDRLPVLVTDAAIDDTPRPSRPSSTSSEVRRRPVILPGGPADRRTKVRGAVGGPSRLAHRVVAPRRPNGARPAPAATSIAGAPPSPTMATAIVAVHPAERPVIVSRDAGLAATLQALVHPSRPPVDVAAAAPALRHVPTPARRGGGPAAHAAAPAHRAWAPTTTSTPASMIGSPARGHPVGPVATGPSSSHRSSVRLTPSPRRATGGIDAPDRWPAAGHVAPTSPPTGLAGLVGWWESEQASAAGHDVVGPSRRLTVDAPAKPSELDGDGAEPLTVFRNALELVLLDEALDAGLEVD